MKDTKALIVDRAFRLFLERGYEGASMADLVAAAGLSKGAVYHHFKDKDALHAAAIEHFFLRFFEPTETERSQETDASLEQVVDELCAGYARLISEIAEVVPDLSAYYRFVFSILPKVRPMMTRQIAATRARLVAAVRRDQARGRLPAGLSPDAVADQCLALIEGGGLICVLEAAEDVGAVFRRTIPDYLRALRGAAPV